MPIDLNEKKKILLVDDDEIHLTTAKLFLEKEYQVYRAKSGNDALELLTVNKLIPDLILLDIIMPSMDGWEVYNRLKAVSYLAGVPIAFLTSVNEIKDKNRAIEIGAADFFVKPYNEADLKFRIAKIFEKKNDGST